jgi:hypothetical protein
VDTVFADWISSRPLLFLREGFPQPGRLETTVADHVNAD